MFRTLKADEIELRVGACSESGFSLLLYKDARCDMNLLDETVGAMNWKRSHEVVDGRLCCTVSVWDDNKGQWISKQDVGTESFTEKDKGQFSDSFKRACVNIGIGRELYTAPFIWIKAKTKEVNGRYRPADNYEKKLRVATIEYHPSKSIKRLVIKDNANKVVFSYGGDDEEPPMTRAELMDKAEALCETKGLSMDKILKQKGVSHLAEFDDDRLTKLVGWLESQ